MKYWRGYLVALILAAITGALVAFAGAHSVLVDMIYPYLTRLIINSLAEWTGGFGLCLWQTLLLLLVLGAIGFTVYLIYRRRNLIQWIGWALAVIMFFTLCHTGLYGLNAYASPLADDVRLEVTDYTVSELNEATVFFRDKAKESSFSIQRNDKGVPQLESFETLAAKAGDGFRVLAYEKTMSVFAGSTAPVKKLGWSFLYSIGKDSGATFPLTGEAAVNPSVPKAVLPFAMCKEMAHRMSVYSETDAQFAAFLAGIHNPDPVFQYSAYLMAYKYCYDALASIPTSAAKAAAKETDAGLTQNMRTDLTAYTKFFGERKVTANLKTGATDEPTEPEQHHTITFSVYTDVSDLLASWYIQTYIVPLHKEEEKPFDPLDPNQVDLTVTAPTTAG